jgi:hypothetical protein
MPQPIFCPLSDMAIGHLKNLTESYRLAVAAAAEYNNIALADRRQIENALILADRLGEMINHYICSWKAGVPCMIYNCGWEYCERNLQILNSLDNLPYQGNFQPGANLPNETPAEPENKE